MSAPIIPERGNPGLGRVASGVSWVALGHLVSQLSWIGSLVVLAALLEPSAIGTVTIAMLVVQVAWLVVGAGTRADIVVTRVLTLDRLGGAVVRTVASGVALGGLLAIGAEPVMAVLASGGDPLVLRWLTASILLYALSIVPLALLQRQLRFRQHSACVGGAALIASAIAVAAAIAGAGVWALVGRQIAFQLLSAAFAWYSVRDVLPGRSSVSASFLRAAVESRPQALSFFALALTSFIAMNVDYVIVGRVTDVELLGVYALAFGLAFAPQTQFAWQVGKVLFPAAAATVDPQDVRRRALRAVRLAALILLPIVPPAIVLAPVVLPQLLGLEWEPMVVPFQLLLLAGIFHGVLAILREFLLGAGHARFCAWIEAVWLVLQVATLLVLVPTYGIRGAAMAHLIVLVPLALAYVYAGAPRLQIEPGELARSLGRVVVPAAAQATATLLILTALEPHASEALASTVAAAGGVAVFILIASSGRRAPLREGREVVVAMLRRAT